MSYIPGTEYRMTPNMAPSAAHGRNYKKLHRRRGTTEKDMKLLSHMSQIPEVAKRLHANIAMRQNFLNQQESSNIIDEQQRLQGILSLHRDPSLNDGRALQTRLKYLQGRMAQLKPQPLSGPEGLYL